MVTNQIRRTIRNEHLVHVIVIKGGISVDYIIVFRAATVTKWR